MNPPRRLDFRSRRRWWHLLFWRRVRLHHRLHSQIWLQPASNYTHKKIFLPPEKINLWVKVVANCLCSVAYATHTPELHFKLGASSQWPIPKSGTVDWKALPIWYDMIQKFITRVVDITIESDLIVQFFFWIFLNILFFALNAWVSNFNQTLERSNVFARMRMRATLTLINHKDRL